MTTPRAEAIPAGPVAKSQEQEAQPTAQEAGITEATPCRVDGTSSSQFGRLASPGLLLTV